MHYFIAMLGGLALGVYWDAAKNKVGKISGDTGRYNFSALRWGLLSALLIPGFIYLTRRKELLARAREHPVEAGNVRRNKAMIACATGVLVFLFSYGGESRNVSMVKGGLLNANQKLTVGEAMDNYSGFRSCKWSSEATPNGIQLVNACGELDLGKTTFGDILGRMDQRGALRRLEAVFEFTLNRDGETFEYTGFDIRVTLGDGTTTGLDEWKELMVANEDGKLKGLSTQEIVEYQKNRPPQAADEWELRFNLPLAAQVRASALDRVYDNQPML